MESYKLRMLFEAIHEEFSKQRAGSHDYVVLQDLRMRVADMTLRAEMNEHEETMRKAVDR